MQWDYIVCTVVMCIGYYIGSTLSAPWQCARVITLGLHRLDSGIVQLHFTEITSAAPRYRALVITLGLHRLYLGGMNWPLHWDYIACTQVAYTCYYIGIASAAPWQYELAIPLGLHCLHPGSVQLLLGPTLELHRLHRGIVDSLCHW